MRKMRMCFPKEKTFADGFVEYVLDCKARNLREGTIHHYEESIKQIYKRSRERLQQIYGAASQGRGASFHR